MIFDRQAKSSKIEEAPKLRFLVILDTSIFYYFACTAIPLIILRRKVGESFSLTNLLGAANEAFLFVFYIKVLRGLSPKSPKALKNYGITFSANPLRVAAVQKNYGITPSTHPHRCVAVQKNYGITPSANPLRVAAIRSKEFAFSAGQIVLISAISTGESYDA